MAGNRVISAVLTLKDKDFTSTAKKAASNTKDFERAVKHTTNSVKQFGQSATSNLKKVALGATSIVSAIGVTKALSGTFNMVKSSIGSAFDRIDTMESFTRTMTTLTGSAEETKAALEATRDAVTGTGYGLDVAAKSVQGFVTRGMDISKATKMVEQWGDAVAFYGEGSNEQFETVSDALGKMYSSGKVGRDQLNRLFDVGIDAVGTYAKAVGRDSTVIEKELSKGKISAADFIDVVGTAFTEGTNGVQKIAGAAKNAGSSWGNTMANMRAKVTRGVEDIIIKFDEMLKESGLPDMRTAISMFGTKFEGVLKSIGGKIPLLSGVIVAMHDKIKPGLDWLKDVAFVHIKDAVSELGNRSLVVRDWMVGAFQAIKERVQENSPVIEGVKGVLQDLGDKAIVVKGWLLEAFEASKPALEWLKDEGLPLVVDGIAGVVDTATGLYTYINDNWNAISPIVYGIATAIGVYKVGMVVATTATTIMTGVTTAMTIAQGALNAVMAISPFGWIALAIGAVVGIGIALYKNWDTIKEKAVELWGVIYDNPLLALVLGPMGMLIAAGIEIHKNWDDIKLAGQLMWDKTKEVFGGMYDWAKEKIIPITSFFADLYGKFTDFKTAISSFTPPEWVSKIGGAIGGAVSKVQGFIAGSHATGLNRVPYDGYVAELHKDEMVVPAGPSRALRSQGMSIDNIGQGGPSVSNSHSTKNSNNIFNISINAQDRSAKDIVNELVPMLQLRLANM